MLALAGKRILVTRPEGQAAGLVELLRGQGAHPVEVPAIRIVPAADPAPLATCVQELATFQWVIFTSANGVEFFFRELVAQGADAGRLFHARVCAIGPATAEALCALGVVPAVMPAEFKGEAVAEAISSACGGDMRGQRVLLPRAGKARDVVPDTLRRLGATVDVVTAYEAAPASDEDSRRLRGLFERGELDAVTFTASSTVESLCRILGPAAPQLLGRLVVASIGPITSATAERLGVRVDVTAVDYTHEGLVRALCAHVRKDPS